MPAGKPVTENIQWIIVCMGAAMSAECIAMYTDMGEHKVHDILAHFKQLGDVKVPKCQRPKLYKNFVIIISRCVTCIYLCNYHSQLPNGTFSILLVVCSICTWMNCAWNC